MEIFVEVEGVTVQGGFAPDVVPQRITKVGDSSFPEPKHPWYAALMTGRYDCDYVEITGIGQRTWKAEPPSTVLFLEVAVEGGTVRAWFWEHSPRGPGSVHRCPRAPAWQRGRVGVAGLDRHGASR